MRERVTAKDTYIRATMLWHWSKEKVSPGDPEEREEVPLRGATWGTGLEPAGV